MIWRNWSGDRPCRPRELLTAGSVTDVVATVQRAAAEHRSLRVIGSGHSYSDIAHGEDLMLSIDPMARVLDADPSSGLVRVEAGITLGALHAELDRLGLALPSLGEIDKQTLAGAIATDTHGSGLRFGSLGAQVAALTLVTADGAVIEIGDEDIELLRAARVGLGALGVVTAITMRCVPAFTLHQARYVERLDTLLERIDELVATHDHVNVFVFPHARRALVLERNRVALAPVPRSAARTWLEDVFLENQVMDAVCRAAGRMPAITRPLTRALVGLARPDVRVDRSHEIFTSEVGFPVISAEWGLPGDAAVTAIDAVTTLFARERFPIAMPFLCRWGRASEELLSPAHGRDTCYLEVLAHAAAPAEPMLRSSEELMDDLGGRPHWAKRFRATAPQLAPRYPAWERFAAVRARLDPDGRFANRYTERVLGPIAG